MDTSARLLPAALIGLFIVGACAGQSAQWTYAPVAVTVDESPGGSPGAPAESAAPVGSTPPARSPAPAGDEERVIDLVATAALQFTTPDGTQVADIPVTPGETVLLRVDNAAGFDHNVYIGTDAELAVPSATTDIGIPTWQSGVQEVTWTVPDDVSGLKFGCTVPGHYNTMKGTFAVTVDESPGGSPGAPAESAAPVGSTPPARSPAPAGDEERVIDLVATAALQFTTPDGTQVADIPVTPGETVLLRVDNAAGFDHNVYIGTDAQLAVPSATTDIGIPTWQSGVQEVTWTVPDDVSGLKFGCTVPGHYNTMKGTFAVTG